MNINGLKDSLYQVIDKWAMGMSDGDDWDELGIYYTPETASLMVEAVFSVLAVQKNYHDYLWSEDLLKT